MKNKKIVIFVLIILIILFCAVIVDSPKTDKLKENAIETNELILEPQIEENEKPKFTKEDSMLKGIKLGMLAVEVKEKLGEPEKIEHQEISEYVSFESMTYYYKDLILVFTQAKDKEELVLNEVRIMGPSVKLDNGLTIGSSHSEVIDSYYNDKQERKYEDTNTKEALAMFLYGDYLYTFSKDSKIPEKQEQTGYVDLETDSIYYSVYTPTKENYIEDTRIIFYFDGENKVAGIRWGNFKILL